MMRVMVFLNSGSACVVRCSTMEDKPLDVLIFFNEKQEKAGEFKHDQLAGWAIIHEADLEPNTADKMRAGEKLQ